MVELGDFPIPLPRLGTLRIRTSLLAEVNARAFLENTYRNSEAVVLKCQGLPGLLLVDKCLALVLVNAVLGFPAPIATGPLSRVERGILDAVLATVFGGLDFGARLRLEPGSAYDVPAEVGAVAIFAELNGQGGRAYLCGSKEFLREAWTAREPRSPQGRVALRLVVARTRVPPSALATAEVGDIVIFDDQAPLSPSAPWPILVCHPSRAWAARLDPDGVVYLDDEPGPDPGTTRNARGASMLRRENLGPASDPEVVAELGELESRAMVDLICGGIRGVSRTRAVLLRVGDTPWAEGELAEMDGSPAVRITRKLAG